MVGGGGGGANTKSKVTTYPHTHTHGARHTAVAPELFPIWRAHSRLTNAISIQMALRSSELTCSVHFHFNQNAFYIFELSCVRTTLRLRLRLQLRCPSMPSQFVSYSILLAHFLFPIASSFVYHSRLIRLVWYVWVCVHCAVWGMCANQTLHTFSSSIHALRAHSAHYEYISI